MLTTVLALLIQVASADSDSLAREPISPLPVQVVIADKYKVELGRLLFQEKNLSKDGTVSCMSCHNLSRGGADVGAISVGVGGAKGIINTPTAFNTVFNITQFWDGRARNLEEQARGPLLAKHEMAGDWKTMVRKLSSTANYSRMFAAVYKDGITENNIVDALAQFQKTLVTPNARFDRHLRGDTASLTELEKEGYRKFKSYGCIACHQGVNVGGNMYQTMGVMGNYFQDRGTPVGTADFGRFNITQRPEDKFVFRVPSLRNVASTAPYFHDGTANTLNEAVRVMAKYQLGRDLSDEDITAIVAFLGTLTGETPAVLAPKAKGNP